MTMAVIVSKVPLEAAECVLFVTRAQYHPILRKRLTHYANGGTRNKREAVNFKKQGVRPGVSDFFIPYPCNGYHGLWIEMKRRCAKLSRVSKEQKEWLELMRSDGYAAYVAYGADHAWEIWMDYIKL
jgi:hypothetical protein